MNLEDLKSTWKSVEPDIERMTRRYDGASYPRNRLNGKSKVLRRIFIGAIITAVCLLLMVTSRIWAPMKFPIPWLAVMCVLIFIGLLAELYLAWRIKNIDLYNSTHTELLASVIRIKRHYRKIELWISVAVAIMMGWLTFMPPFVNTWRMAEGWGLLAIGLAAEYLWYRKNIRYLDSIKDWTTELNTLLL